MNRPSKFRGNGSSTYYRKSNFKHSNEIGKNCKRRHSEINDMDIFFMVRKREIVFIRGNP